MRILRSVFSGICLVAFSPVAAEIVSASADHFVLRHEARSDLTPGELWNRLIQPALWWHPDHTYSSNANNLRLSPQAGGLWREDWKDGSVLHGQVVYAKPERMLRLQAPFGPLQSRGIYTVWTISITPTDGGSIVVFDEVATGSSNTDLISLAKDADFVKGEALKRLADLP